MDQRLERISSVDERQGVFIEDSATVTGPVIGINQGTVVTQLPPEIPAPPPPQPVPGIADFVGREAELSYFAEKLRTFHLAVISGMPGVGKTALAAVLALRSSPPELIFWHSFYRGEGVEPVIWQLASFLYGHGNHELWRLLNSTRNSGGYSLPPTVLFDYALKLLRGQGYVVCLDDFHVVDKDPLLEELVERLRPLLIGGELSLILTSRRLPSMMRLTEFEPLGGLSFADTQTLLSRSDLALSDDLAADLYKHTDGNAEILTLAIETLRRAADRSSVIANLEEADDIERYLLTEVDRELKDDERDVLSAIAVLLGQPGSPDAIEHILDGASVRRVVLELYDRRLLRLTEVGGEEVYAEHAIVQAFYYDMLSSRERREMHRRAAEYYAGGRADMLKAAEHYHRAGEHARAAECATSDVWATINHGQARALLSLLGRLEPGTLSPEQWVRLCLARGQVHGLLGDVQPAREQYQAALAQLETLPDGPGERTLFAIACRGMGELLEQESPQEALTWLQRGLERIDGSSAHEEAALRINIGMVEMTQGRYAEAQATLEQGLSELPDGANRLRSTALMTLAMVHTYQSNLEHGNQYAQQALAISEQSYDRVQTAGILSNLGIARYIQGNWQDAVADFERGLTLAEELGSQKLITSLEANLGVAFINMGADQAAREHLLRAIERAQRNKLHFYEYVARLKLADLSIRLKQGAQAEPELREAERLAQLMDTPVDLIDVYRLMAEAALSDGDTAAASAHAQRAITLADELGEQGSVRGKNLRVLAQALHAEGEHRRAAEHLQQSYALLATVDPYEAARTQVVLGRVLLASGDNEQARTLLETARQTFAGLGARRDLGAVMQETDVQ